MFIHDERLLMLESEDREGLPFRTLLKDEGDVIGSKQGHTGDALASAGDEGRDKLR